MGEAGYAAKIDRRTGLGMTVTLMERDWTTTVCTQKDVEMWGVFLKDAGALVGSAAACVGSAGIGCAFGIATTIISAIEEAFSLDPDPVCGIVDDPDDYMGSEMWYISNLDALKKTSENGAYAFHFDMPSSHKKNSRKHVLWGYRETCLDNSNNAC